MVEHNRRHRSAGKSCGTPRLCKGISLFGLGPYAAGNRHRVTLLAFLDLADQPAVRLIVGSALGLAIVPSSTLAIFNAAALAKLWIRLHKIEFTQETALLPGLFLEREVQCLA